MGSQVQPLCCPHSPPPPQLTSTTQLFPHPQHLQWCSRQSRAAYTYPPPPPSTQSFPHPQHPQWCSGRSWQLILPPPPPPHTHTHRVLTLIILSGVVDDPGQFIPPTPPPPPPHTHTHTHMDDPGQFITPPTHTHTQSPHPHHPQWRSGQSWAARQCSSSPGPWSSK